MSNPIEAATPAVEEHVRHPVNSLTGLRWVAMLCVFFSHSLSDPGVFAPSPAIKVIGSVLAPAGNTGVSFFFVLSGFVLVWSTRRSDTAPKFWRRRFFRIYPNHLVMCAVAIVLMLITGNLVDLHDVWQTLLLQQDWNTSFVSATGVNGVSWSLGCEVVFYFCFPLLLALVRRITPARLVWWAIGLIAVVFLVPLAAQLLPATPTVPVGFPFSDAGTWLVVRFPVTRMVEFVLGIVLARMVLTGRYPRVPTPLAWLVMLAGWVVAVFLQDSLWGLVATTIIPIAVLVPAVAKGDLAERRSWLAHPVTVWLGQTSFAFYLVHLLVLEYVVFAFSGSIAHWQPLSGWSGVGILAVALFGALGLATVLRACVETPMYKRFAISRRRNGSGRSGAPRPADVAPAPAS